MTFSVIVCTYLRAEALGNFLNCLAAQDYADFEVLVIDGSGADHDAVAAIAEARAMVPGLRGRLRYLRAPRGLTHQRNIGLREARGAVIGFFDDDITFGLDFLGRAVRLLGSEEMADVGGLTGFDARHYPAPVGARWKLRWFLGTIPSLTPGDADHLGRHVPMTFIKAGTGCAAVAWLPGFCQIYRRSAIEGRQFDEALPTYGGEDRDFSIDVARDWRLLLDRSLLLEHHVNPVGRVDATRRVGESGFGMGRSFAKRRRGRSDRVMIVRYMIAELIIDLLGALAHPSWSRIATAIARQVGIIRGLRSVRSL